MIALPAPLPYHDQQNQNATRLKIMLHMNELLRRYVLATAA